MQLVSQRKVPIIEWIKWSAVLDTQLERVVSQLQKIEYSALATELEEYRWRLNALRMKMEQKQEQADQLRQNMAMCCKHILRRLHIGLEALLNHWQCSYTGPFPSAAAADICGQFSMSEPYGLADGWPRMGYLPWIIRNLIFEQIGFLWQGSCKPRGAVWGAHSEFGYHEIAKRAHEGKTYFDLIRHTLK